ETSRTKVALLGSEAKIGKLEREILHHDLSGVEETLGKRFYLEMVRKGVVPKLPSDDEGSERPRKTSKKSDGDEGPPDPHGPLMSLKGVTDRKAEEADDELEVEEAGAEPEVEEAGVEPEVEETGDEPEAEGANVELEVEEPDGAPEATIRTGSQRLRDLEALCRHERIREAESETSRTEGAVPKPPSDDEGSERPRKMPNKSDEDEGPSDPRGPLMIMPPKPMSEARMREIIRDQFTSSMNEFMANINNGTGNADGTGVRGAGPTISECKEKDRVKFAMATLRGRALTWWNGRTKAMGIEADNNTPWSEVRKWMTEEFCPRSVIQIMEQELYNLRMKGMDIDGYINRFHELALLCPRMVEPEAVKVEQYLRGLTKSIRGDFTSSQPATINDAVRLAYQLAGQLIQDKADEATEGEKRKGEGDRGSRGDNRREHNRRQNQKRGNAGAMTSKSCYR
nr:hypothetical protein [Tanacetum cinerariifolium]